MQRRNLPDIKRCDQKHEADIQPPQNPRGTANRTIPRNTAKPVAQSARQSGAQYRPGMRKRNQKRPKQPDGQMLQLMRKEKPLPGTGQRPVKGESQQNHRQGKKPMPYGANTLARQPGAVCTAQIKPCKPAKHNKRKRRDERPERIKTHHIQPDTPTL